MEGFVIPLAAASASFLAVFAAAASTAANFASVNLIFLVSDAGWVDPKVADPPKISLEE
jgi:hypothetical protein